MCLKIYHLDSVKFFSSPKLAQEVAFKKTNLKSKLLTDTDILLIVEKKIREEICHAIHQYAKVNNKHINDNDKNKELSYLKYWDANNSSD